MAKRKYCDMYYTIRKTDKGYTWYLYFDWPKGSKIIQSSLDADDEDDRYYETAGRAACDATDAIEDHYD